jgi:hypothetical protein
MSDKRDILVKAPLLEALSNVAPICTVKQKFTGNRFTSSPLRRPDETAFWRFEVYAKFGDRQNRAVFALFQRHLPPKS